MAYTGKDKIYTDYIQILKVYKKFIETGKVTPKKKDKLITDQQFEELLAHATELFSPTNPELTKENKLVSTQKDFILLSLQTYAFKQQISLEYYMHPEAYILYKKLYAERNKTKTKDKDRQDGAYNEQAYVRTQRKNNPSYKLGEITEQDINKLMKAFSKQLTLDLFPSYPSKVNTAEVLFNLPSQHNISLSDVLADQYTLLPTYTQKQIRNRADGLLEGAIMTFIPKDAPGYLALSNYRTIGLTVWTHKVLLEQKVNKQTKKPYLEIPKNYLNAYKVIKANLPKGWVLEDDIEEDLQDITSFLHYPDYIAYTFILKIHDYDEVLTARGQGHDDIYDAAVSTDYLVRGNYY